MKFFNILAFSAVILAFSPLQAEAGAKPSIFGWSLPFWHVGHFETMDFEERYLNSGQFMLNEQWADDPWHPRDWANDRGSAEEVMRGFYKAGLIERQYKRWGTPVLVVGHRFMRLSPLDQRRVANFVGYAYGVDKAESGFYELVHGPSCDPIGVYTSAGLQLQ